MARRNSSRMISLSVYLAEAIGSTVVPIMDYTRHDGPARNGGYRHDSRAYNGGYRHDGRILIRMTENGLLTVL